MSECPFCKTRIKNGATVCPGCKAEYRSQGEKIFYAILAATISAIIIATALWMTYKDPAGIKSIIGLPIGVYIFFAVAILVEFISIKIIVKTIASGIPKAWYRNMRT